MVRSHEEHMQALKAFEKAETKIAAARLEKFSEKL
jgi:hypothetical protein